MSAPHVSVYRVMAPMPEMGALPGDYLYAEPAHPDFPLTLNRHFDRSILRVLADPRLKLVRTGGYQAPAGSSAPDDGDVRRAGTLVGRRTQDPQVVRLVVQHA